MDDLPLMWPCPPAWRRRNDQRIAQLRPEMRGMAKAHVERCWAHGLPVVLMPPVRTDAEQAKLYAQGRTAPGSIVTNAPTSDSSPHGERWRAAYDLAFLVDGQLVSPGPVEPHSWSGDFERAGELGEAVGLVWGGRWRTRTFPHGDRPHFELPRWRDLPRLS